MAKKYDRTGIRMLTETMGAGLPEPEDPNRIERSRLLFNDVNTDIYGDAREPNPELIALARDIGAVGIKEPLQVYPETPDRKRFIVISGNRRLAAWDYCNKELHMTPSPLIPVIYEDKPEDDLELKSRLIKNNLYRTKSGWARMMEIVTYFDVVRHHEESVGADASITSVMESVSNELGISVSEIKRLRKIHDQLVPDLMEVFRSGHTELGDSVIAVSVAVLLANLPEDQQKYIYQNMDPSQVLTGTMVNKLIENRNKSESKKQDQQETDRTPTEQNQPETTPDSGDEPAVTEGDPSKPSSETGKTIKKEQIVPDSLEEGLEQVMTALNNLKDADLPEVNGIRAEKLERRLCKKIRNILANLDAIQVEIPKLRSYTKPSAETGDEEKQSEESSDENTEAEGEAEVEVDQTK